MPARSTLLLAAGFILIGTQSSSCKMPNHEEAPKTSLTTGQVQMTLKKGITTKTQVLETFGSPNITTRDGNGREVWTYQRQAEMATSTNGYLTVIFAGGSTSGFERSSRSITLIIKFDENDVVSDYNSMTTNF